MTIFSYQFEHFHHRFINKLYPRAISIRCAVKDIDLRSTPSLNHLLVVGVNLCQSLFLKNRFLKRVKCIVLVRNEIAFTLFRIIHSMQPLPTKSYVTNNQHFHLIIKISVLCIHVTKQLVCPLLSRSRSLRLTHHLMHHQISRGRKKMNDLCCSSFLN